MHIGERIVEVSSNTGYEAGSNAVNTTFQNKSIARAKTVFIRKNCEDLMQ